MSTQDVLNHHLQSFGAGDADEIIKDYTEESVLITPEATFRGIDELRGFFEEGFTGLFRPGTFDFAMGRVEVIGDVAFISWSTTGESADIPLGTDTFLIRGGKITLQTFAASVQAK